MANKVFLNNGIVECQVVGDQTVESVMTMGRHIKSLLSELKAQGQPLVILDDVTKIGRVPNSARKAVIQFVKELQYNRLVMLGDNGLVRLGANLIFRASGRSKKVKFFTNRSEAIRWLKEK